MSLPQRPEPDLSNHGLNATGVVGASAAEADGKTDFAQLAAAFAQSGGGFSPELSTDLALEIVLNEIVVEACLMTGATGAAVALERAGEMICRGSSGSPAPTLGSRLDAAWGLSGECIRTRKTERSEDVLADPRVDLETSHRLGIRSIVVMPLVRANELLGLFELFSSLPLAFGERDERTLEAMAQRIYSCLDSAAQPLLPQQDEPVAVSEVQETAGEASGFINSKSEDSKPEDSTLEISPQRGFDAVIWALRGAALVCAVMLVLLLGRHLVGPRKAGIERSPARLHSVPPSADKGALAAAGSTAVDLTLDSSPHTQRQGDAEAQPPTPAPSHSSPPAGVSHATRATPAPVVPGSLQIFENGKEIFRMPPARHELAETGTVRGRADSPLGSGVRRASSAEPEKEAGGSAAVAEGSLLHRVEPRYPEDAMRQQIQGTVVLDVQIGRDGSVQDVRSVSGPPELAQASTDAVKQWRFKPRRVNGRPSPMQTRVTLNFKLPR